MHKELTPGKHLAVVGAITAAVVIAVFVVVGLFLSRPTPPVDPNEVQGAIRRFCAEHRPHPPTVTFSQLIAQGYMASNMLQRFGAAEVTVNLSADERYPQTYVMDALMPDGTHTTGLSDGSVQDFSNGQFERLPSPGAGPMRLLGNSNAPGKAGNVREQGSP